MLVLYMDEILLTNSDYGLLYETKIFLIKKFKMVDMNDVYYIINIDIFRDISQILLRLFQKKYIDRVFEIFNMQLYLVNVIHITKDTVLGY